jgi:hypothetical protein
LGYLPSAHFRESLPAVRACLISCPPQAVRKLEQHSLFSYIYAVEREILIVFCVKILSTGIFMRPLRVFGQSAPGAQGIEAEILLAQPKDWSEKPGLRRFTPQMRPNSEL